MNFNYTLKYQTFDSLLESVRVDMKNFSLEGKIEPQQLIKIALKCNYDLGLRINMIKEKVLDVSSGKARLPDDFRVMNYALICGNYTDTFVNPQGTDIEEVPVSKSQIPLYQDPIEPNACTDVIINPCTPTLTPNTTTPLCLTRCVDNCNNPTLGYQLVQKIHTTTRHYHYMYPVRFKNSHEMNCESPNLNWMCRDEAFIRNDFIWFHDHNEHSNHNHQHQSNHHRNDMNGKCFINYEGALEDDDGNVLVPDHPMINEYYEDAIKQRLLENLIMDGEEGVDKPYQLITAKLRISRSAAMSIVGTPNFSEISRLHDANRKAHLSKFYHMFSSFPPPPRVFAPVNNVI